VIAVTCRTGERFSVDPDHIERVEHHGDTVLHLLDGTRHVVDADFDELLCSISAHRARALVACARLVDGYAALPHVARLARRHGSGTESFLP